MRRFRPFLRGNVGALALVSLLNDASSEMIYPLLPIFLVQILGAGPAFLGLVEGIAETTSSIVKLASGWLSDRIGMRKALVGWGYGVAAVGRPLIAAATAPWHVLVIRFADRFGKGVRTAPRDALLADSVAPDWRGTAFGVHRAADHAGAVIGPLLATALLTVFAATLRLVFALALIPAAVGLLVVWKGVREVRPPAMAVEQHPAVSLRDLGPSLPRFLVVVALFTLGNASDTFLLLRVRELGVATAWIPLLWAGFHVSKMAWSVPGGMLSDRFDARRVIVAGWCVYAAVYAGFAGATAAWEAWALVAVYGLFFGLTEAPEKALVASLAPRTVRAGAFGAYHLAIGMTSLPASILFGVVWQAFGAASAFLLGAAIALVAAALLPLVVRHHRSSSRPHGRP